jgi:ribosomal protein S27E
MNSYNQNVLDVDGQLNTANATFHPVKGPQNNPFASVNTMLSPWNTKAAPAAHPNQAVTNGPVISCWDCHETLTTAHGGTGTLRSGTSLDYNAALGAVTAGGDTLCLTCHNGTGIYTSSTTTVQSAYGGLNSGTTYPPADTGASHMSRMTNANTGVCTTCHSSSFVSPGRPFRADDVHGGNSVPHYRVPTGLTTGGPAVTIAGTNWTGATAANLLYTGGTNAVYNNTAQNNLSITAWGFPAAEFTGTTITGIGVIIEGNGADANAVNRRIRVNVSKTAGTAAGTWKTIELPQTTDQVVVAGGPGDLWGTTWATTDFSATGFGILISDNDTTAAAINLDQVRIVVYTDKWANVTGTVSGTTNTGSRPYSFLRNAGDKTATLNQTKWNSWRGRKDGATTNAAWGCSWYSDTTSNPCSRTGDHVNTWISYGPGGVY